MSKKKINFRMSEADLVDLKEMAAHSGVSLSEIIRSIIAFYLMLYRKGLK